MHPPHQADPDEWRKKLCELSRHLTVEQIADHLQCSPRYVAYLKAGRQHDPRVSISDRLRGLHAELCQRASD